MLKLSNLVDLITSHIETIDEIGVVFQEELCLEEERTKLGIPSTHLSEVYAMSASILEQEADINLVDMASIGERAYCPYTTCCENAV